MTDKAKTAHISLRADEAFKTRLLDASLKEGRTPTNLILYAVRLYLDQHHPEIKPSELDAHSVQEVGV